MTDATTPAWLLDQPYDCENGPGRVSNLDCTGGKDDTLTSSTVSFQTFIESDLNINGTDYNVLYGGVQWSYAFKTVETPTPEPPSLLCAVPFCAPPV
jgi:hypothetical protein